jgi:hypothetical protein
MYIYFVGETEEIVDADIAMGNKLVTTQCNRLISV